MSDLYGAEKRVSKMLRRQSKDMNAQLQVKNVTKEHWIKHFASLNTVSGYKENSSKVDIKSVELYMK